MLSLQLILLFFPMT